MSKPLTMGSRALASVRPLQPTRRTLASSSKSSLQQNFRPRQPIYAPTQALPSLRRSFHRTCARSGPHVELAPTPKPKKRFGIFRWTWRLTKLGVVGGVGYIGYTVWESRHPADQELPDPSKKTLVVLGMSFRSSNALGDPRRSSSIPY